MRIFPSQSTVMKRNVGSTDLLTIGQIETILLGNPRPIIDARSPEGIHAELDLGVAHRIHVDNTIEIA
jgi:hypothetical protein